LDKRFEIAADALRLDLILLGDLAQFQLGVQIPFDPHLAPEGAGIDVIDR